MAERRNRVIKERGRERWREGEGCVRSENEVGTKRGRWRGEVGNDVKGKKGK